MAKMLSHLMSVMRGSVGGITYSANQFAQIIAKTRTSPVNPNTNRQTQIRTAFADAGVLWEQQGDVVRQGWDDYARTCHYEGPLGSYTVPGRQMFIACIGTASYLKNDRGLTLGAISTDPPIIPGWLSIHNPGVTVPIPGETGYAITGGNNNVESIIAYAFRSFAYPASRYRNKGPFLTETLDEAGPLAPPGSFTIPFYGLSPLLVYFNVLRFISSEPPFRISEAVYLRAIATTTPV